MYVVVAGSLVDSLVGAQVGFWPLAQVVVVIWAWAGSLAEGVAGAWAGTGSSV